MWPKNEKPSLLANLYVDLILFIRGKYCYGFRFGPTDAQGKLRIAYQDVENERAKAASYDLMDYNTPIDNCDDILKIKLPSRSRGCRKAYEWQIKSPN